MASVFGEAKRQRAGEAKRQRAFAERLSGCERARRGVTAACGVFKAAVTGYGMRSRARPRLGEAASGERRAPTRSNN